MLRNQVLNPRALTLIRIRSGRTACGDVRRPQRVKDKSRRERRPAIITDVISVIHDVL